MVPQTLIPVIEGIDALIIVTSSMPKSLPSADDSLHYTFDQGADPFQVLIIRFQIG